MDAEACVLFLTALQARKIRIKDNGWVECSCVLAPWTHRTKADHSPSFGLSINPGERSHYSCFGCTLSGSAEELIQLLELYTREKPHPYDFAQCRQLLDAEPQLLPLPEYGGPAHPASVFTEWPQYWIESFMSVDARAEPVEYLVGRNVSILTAKQFDLRYDTKRQMIVCPYRDVFGRLAGARGRSILPDVTGPQKHFDYSWQSKNNCRLCWYNEPVLQEAGPVVVVEGQFDCWRTQFAYPKVVANLTAKPTLEKMKKLGGCPFIIQIPDRDDAGTLSMGLYAKLCTQLGIGYKMLWLDEGVKDPDECSPLYLKDKIEALL